MKILFLLIISINIYASEGMVRLNAFPKKTNFQKINITFEKETISASKNSSSKNDIEQKHTHMTYTYGHKLNSKKFYGISLPFTTSKENEVTTSGATTTSYRSKGLTEPSFLFHHRFNNTLESLKDISLKFTPSLFEKKSGTTNANKAVGGHKLQVKSSWGAIYQEWESRIQLDYTYNFNSKDENLKTGVTTTTEGFYQVLIGIEFQYLISDKWFANFGSGLQLSQDAHLNNSGTAESTRVQLGTGSVGFIGISYKLKTEAYLFKLFRSKNDFFVEAPSSNFKGDFTKTFLAFDYIKSF